MFLGENWKLLIAAGKLQVPIGNSTSVEYAVGWLIPSQSLAPSLSTASNIEAIPGHLVLGKNWKHAGWLLKAFDFLMKTRNVVDSPCLPIILGGGYFYHLITDRKDKEILEMLALMSWIHWSHWSNSGHPPLHNLLACNKNKEALFVQPLSFVFSVISNWKHLDWWNHLCFPHSHSVCCGKQRKYSVL